MQKKISDKINKDEFIEQWNNFLDCMNFPQSTLNTNAIRFMNGFSRKLDEVIESESITTHDELREILGTTFENLPDGDDELLELYKVTGKV